MSFTGAAAGGHGGSGASASPSATRLGEDFVDVPQVADHRCADVRVLDLGQLEDQRGGDVRLLGLGLAAEEQPRLAVVVGEALGANAALVAVLGRPRAVRKPVLGRLRAASPCASEFGS